MSPSGRRAIPYRERILSYCENNSIQIPQGFDAPKSSYKYVAIDVTVKPYKLHKYSSYNKKEVLSFLKAPENAEKHFKILDFKRCVEVEIDESGKFHAGNKFECELENEVPYLVTP